MPPAAGLHRRVQLAQQRQRLREGMLPTITGFVFEGLGQGCLRLDAATQAPCSAMSVDPQQHGAPSVASDAHQTPLDDSADRCQRSMRGPCAEVSHRQGMPSGKSSDMHGMTMKRTSWPRYAQTPRIFVRKASSLPNSARAKGTKSAATRLLLGASHVPVLGLDGGDELVADERGERPQPPQQGRQQRAQCGLQFMEYEIRCKRLESHKYDEVQHGQKRTAGLRRQNGSGRQVATTYSVGRHACMPRHVALVLDMAQAKWLCPVSTGRSTRCAPGSPWRPKVRQCGSSQAKSRSSRST